MEYETEALQEQSLSAPRKDEGLSLESLGLLPMAIGAHDITRKWHTAP